ncbi:MAG: aldo/keto reductase [Clostridia bacterium]|nr:aldo/keto reductase [Clostridia bacterium]
MQLFTKLNDGSQIPTMGYGVFCIADEECEKHVLNAIKTGYRHVDCAQIYRNERGLGNALAKTDVPREELYITSKVWVSNFGKDKTIKSVDLSLSKLQTPYVNLMLLHRPFGDYISAWKDLEKCVEEGKVNSIGLSNFNKKQTQRILDICKIKPVINQIECHPYGAQNKLKEYLFNNDIAVEAWYPLGHGNKKLMSEKILLALAEKYSKTPAQIILRWHIQNNNIVLPKTVRVERMVENFNALAFELTKEDVALINGLNKNKMLFNVPNWVQKLNNKLFPVNLD